MNNGWISKSARNNIPSIINEKYDYTKEIMDSNGAYASYCAILCVKDLVETIIKIPAIMGLILVDKFIEEDNEFESRIKAEEKEAHYVSLNGILDKMLSSPLSMGSWEDLVNKLIAGKDYFSLPDELVEILVRTKKLVSSNVDNGIGGKYDNIIHWRNDVIGHGVIAMSNTVYMIQLESILGCINSYFQSVYNKKVLNDLYEIISIEKRDSMYYLRVDDNYYSTNHFIELLDSKIYYFDTYYSNKHLVKYSDFIENTVTYKNNSFFENLVERLINLSNAFEINNRSRRSRTREIVLTGEGEKQLACLKNVTKPETPSFIIDKINKEMDILGRGVITLQMERGTGKSTFTHLMDGRYLKKILQEDLNAIVRVYHIGDMNYVSGSGTNPCSDFLKGMPGLFERHPLEGSILRYSDEYIEDMHPKSIVALCNDIEQGCNPKSSIVELLSLFRDIYTVLDKDEEELNREPDENRLVLIIDGIDELGNETIELLNMLPSTEDFERNECANNIFIILTSRKKDEDSLTEVSRRAINLSETLVKNPESIISIDKSDAEYNEMLENYISKQDSSINADEIKRIIEKAQHKILYIRPLLAFGDRLIDDANIDEKTIIKNYTEELKKRYFGLSLNSLYMVMASLALFGKLKLKEIGEIALGEPISYDLIGCINDLMPLLTVNRGDGYDIFEYSNVIYREYVQEEYVSAIRDCINSFLRYVENWATGKIEKNEDITFEEIDDIDKKIHSIRVLYSKFSVYDIKYYEWTTDYNIREYCRLIKSDYFKYDMCRLAVLTIYAAVNEESPNEKVNSLVKEWGECFRKKLYNGDIEAAQWNEILAFIGSNIGGWKDTYNELEGKNCVLDYVCLGLDFDKRAEFLGYVISKSLDFYEENEDLSLANLYSVIRYYDMCCRKEKIIIEEDCGDKVLVSDVIQFNDFEERYIKECEQKRCLEELRNYYIQWKIQEDECYLLSPYVHKYVRDLENINDEQYKFYCKRIIDTYSRYQRIDESVTSDEMLYFISWLIVQNIDLISDIAEQVQNPLMSLEKSVWDSIQMEDSDTCKLRKILCIGFALTNFMEKIGMQSVDSNKYNQLIINLESSKDENHDLFEIKKWISDYKIDPEKSTYEYIMEGSRVFFDSEEFEKHKDAVGLPADVDDWFELVE